MEKVTFEITRQDIDTRAGRTISDTEWQEISGVIYEEMRFVIWDIVDGYLSE